MAISCSKTIVKGMFALSLFVFCSANTASGQPFPDTYERRGTVVREQAGGHFVRTETQQRYYVDSMGRRHLIQREVVEPTAPLGMLYYIENDDRPYYADERQRLYTRDQSGRIFFIDDVGQSGIIEQEVIMRGHRPYTNVQPMRYRESCASQYEKCMSGCQGISRREAYTKPMCINNCEIIKNGCRGE